MAWLLHWRGEGYGWFEGVKEYMQLLDWEEEPLLSEIEARTAPGFSLISMTDLTIDDPPSNIPFDTTLMPHRSG